MSCGEPAWWEELYNSDNELTFADVHKRDTISKTIEWANTPLDELPKLSDLEYFQRNLWKGLGIPESYLVNGVAPSRKVELVTKAYVDANMMPTDPAPGSLFLDTSTGEDLDIMGQLFKYDGKEWVKPATEFGFFDISLVREPLLDECRLPESTEDKYDRAMGGVAQ